MKSLLLSAMGAVAFMVSSLWSGPAQAIPITYHTDLSYEVMNPETGEPDAWGTLELELDFDTDDIPTSWSAAPETASFAASAARVNVTAVNDIFALDGSHASFDGTATIWFMDTGFDILPFLDFQSQFWLDDDWELSIHTSMDLAMITQPSMPDLTELPVYSSADVGSSEAVMYYNHYGMDESECYGFTRDLTLVQSYTVEGQEGVVPEPATALLLSLGICGMVSFRRRG